MEYLWEINNFIGISMEYGNDIMIYIYNPQYGICSMEDLWKYGYDIPILDTSIWGFP